MWQHNDGAGESNILQNQFTAYLVKSIRRSKIHYLRERDKQHQCEISLDYDEHREAYQSDLDFLLGIPTLDQLDNYKLQQALKTKSKRDLYIFFAMVLEDKSFYEIAEELRMEYTTVKSIYYRMIKKIKKELGGEYR